MEKKRLLIADDDPISIDMLAQILGETYDILVAKNGKKAIEIINTDHPNLILLDVEMPDINDYEVCREIKNSESTQDIPVIFVTAKDSADDEEFGLSLGAVDFIKKPFSQNIILARIKTHLKASEQDIMLKNFNYLLLEQVEQEVASRLTLEREKKIQDDLIQQQSKLADLGEMIGVIVHQWKQPISASCLLLDMVEKSLQEYHDIEGKIFNYIENIKKQILYMNQTIDDFRRFLLPSKERKEFIPLDAFNETIKMFEHQLMRYNVQVEFLSQEKFSIIGIQNEITQVFMNLIKNAIDIFEINQIKDRKIHIYFEESEGYGIIKVCDNGGGIPSELLPDKLFEPYVSTKGDKGTGIGLHLIKKIIEEHLDGKITAYNLDNGACFKISLPIVKSKG